MTWPFCRPPSWAGRCIRGWASPNIAGWSHITGCLDPGCRRHGEPESQGSASIIQQDQGPAATVCRIVVSHDLFAGREFERLAAAAAFERGRGVEDNPGTAAGVTGQLYDSSGLNSLFGATIKTGHHQAHGKSSHRSRPMIWMGAGRGRTEHDRQSALNPMGKKRPFTINPYSSSRSPTYSASW